MKICDKIDNYLHCDKIMATINPYNPKASAKINTRIIPTNIFGSIAFALTPESPTTPIAKPAAY